MILARILSVALLWVIEWLIYFAFNRSLFFFLFFFSSSFLCKFIGNITAVFTYKLVGEQLARIVDVEGRKLNVSITPGKFGKPPNINRYGSSPSSFHLIYIPSVRLSVQVHAHYSIFTLVFRNSIVPIHISHTHNDKYANVHSTHIEFLLSGLRNYRMWNDNL